jgi:hypothetical protein
MPKDPTSTEAQQLKEKIVNNKVDKMLDGLWMFKDFAVQIAQRLEKMKLGGVLSFFVKSFWLKEWDIQKLLDRPYIKSWIDSYKTNTTEGQKDADKRKKTRLQLWG